MYIDKNRNKIYRNSKGMWHRLNGPAFENSDGDKGWYKEDQLHRTNGPAIEYSSRYKAWYLLHKEFDEKEFNSWMIRIQKCI